MKTTIKLASLKDLKKYTDLLQQTYQSAYTNEKLGLTADCFSKEIFATDNTQDYLKSHLINNHSQKNAAGLSSSLKLNQAKALKAASRITSNHQPKAVGSSSFKAFLVTKKARFDKNPPANAITTHVGIAILSF